MRFLVINPFFARLFWQLNKIPPFPKAVEIYKPCINQLRFLVEILGWKFFFQVRGENCARKKSKQFF